MTETPHSRDMAHAALRWCGRTLEELGEAEKRTLRRVLARKAVIANPNATFDDGLTFGQRLADKVAVFGGSWTFIIAFAAFLAVWTLLNLALAHRAFDAYPFIFLNLILSMLAAIQAPVIMMSQNRQGAKDRSDAAHDYEVNLKAEIEIMSLHDKLDQMRTEQLESLIIAQQEQITLLTQLLQGQIERPGAT